MSDGFVEWWKGLPIEFKYSFQSEQQARNAWANLEKWRASDVQTQQGRVQASGVGIPG